MLFFFVTISLFFSLLFLGDALYHTMRKFLNAKRRALKNFIVFPIWCLEAFFLFIIRLGPLSRNRKYKLYPRQLQNFSFRRIDFLYHAKVLN